MHEQFKNAGFIKETDSSTWQSSIKTYTDEARTELLLREKKDFK